MDYGQIKNEYPKAYKKACDYFLRKSKGATVIEKTRETFDVFMNLRIVDRMLYDFFDEQGLYISVSPNAGYSSWGCCIYNAIGDNWNLEYGIIINEDTDYVNRTEAEEAAFVAAFEILEQQLNKTLTREGD